MERTTIGLNYSFKKVFLASITGVGLQVADKRPSYLLQFGEGQRIVVLDFELHEAHVGRVGELCYDAESWEQPVKSQEQEAQRERKKEER